ncbi:MAG: hypothetical protein ACXWVJ_01820, partial [Caulobacteraceae bacterium]
MAAASARLVSIATAAPPHIVSQAEATRAAQAMFGDRFDAFARMTGVFGNAGIKTRRAAMPLDWYSEPRGWPERTEAYLSVATDLFVEAASEALAVAGIAASEVDTVVTVSSTGIATPSLEARAFTRMGFRQDVERVPVFGLGCAGGVTGLSLAGRLAKASPGSTVLVVTVELCTLAFR